MAVTINLKELNAQFEELAGDVMLLGTAAKLKGRTVVAAKCGAILDKLIESKTLLNDVAKLGVEGTIIAGGKIVWKDITPNQKVLQKIVFKNLK